MYKQQKQSNNSDLMRYAGMGGQIFVSLGLAVLAGYKLDKWIHVPFPILVWALPLVVLCLMMYKLIKETSKRKKSNDQPKI